MSVSVLESDLMGFLLALGWGCALVWFLGSCLSAPFPPCVGADNKAFFVISMSATGAHIYELVAQTVSEKNV